MKRLTLALAVSAGLLPCPAAAALLLGATVSEQYRYPDLFTPYPVTTYSPPVFVVGAGQESTIVLESVTTFNVDFADTGLNILFDTTLTNPAFVGSAFNGLVFTSTAFSQVAGISVAPTTNFAGFTASRASIVGNELRIDWGGLSYNTDTVLALSFTQATAPVPEPASWALMIAGFGALGVALRRGRRPAPRLRTS